MRIEQLTYTDLPPGKGLSPGGGYKIKACSEGLNAETRNLLSNIVRHYGEAVYRFAPRAAIEREMEWRAHARELDNIPPDILGGFPAIWSYDRLNDDLFALTQVRYIGWTHDGRTGNFFAHALAFSPDSLEMYGYNPLVFARLAPFRSRDNSDDTRLSALSLAAPASIQTDYWKLREAPYRDYLAAMISALCGAVSETRPAMVCLADWRQAAPFAEALIGCLPPTARCRTTLCTHESNRSTAPAHHLLLLCGEDDPSFNLRPDEYSNKYSIFNFVGSQCESGELSPYAIFAAECMENQQMEKLERHHECIEQAGFGKDVSKWEIGLPGVRIPALPEEGPPPPVPVTLPDQQFPRVLRALGTATLALVFLLIGYGLGRVWRAPSTQLVPSPTNEIAVAQAAPSSTTMPTPTALSPTTMPTPTALSPTTMPTPTESVLPGPTLPLDLIQQALSADPLDQLSIDFQPLGNGIRLIGVVPSQALKTQAEERLTIIEGVDLVDSTRLHISPIDLTEPVLSAFAADPNTQALDITVIMIGEEGVSLHGMVPDIDLKTKLESIANSVQGVRFVDGTQVVIEIPDLAAQVLAIFSADVELAPWNIQVEQQDYNIRLSGTVSRPDMKARAEALAKSVPGVSLVDSSDLKVEYTVRSDDTLSHIALHLYGRASLWPIIYEANRNQIADPTFISTGMYLRIP